MKLNKTPTTKTSISKGYRSGLEERIAQELFEQGVQFTYEDIVLKYVKPEQTCRYTPDFFITTKTGKKIIVESKGRFLSPDRKKMIAVKKQFPGLDIRMVFSRSKDRIGKKSKTTYAAWCDKHGFIYADTSVPQEWLDE